MQNAPDVDLTGVIDVEDQVRRFLDPPTSQARDPQQVRVAARADGWMGGECTQRIFELVGKLSGQAWSAFGTAVRKDRVDVGLWSSGDSLLNSPRKPGTETAETGDRPRNRGPRNRGHTKPGTETGDRNRGQTTVAAAQALPKNHGLPLVSPRLKPVTSTAMPRRGRLPQDRPRPAVLRCLADHAKRARCRFDRRHRRRRSGTAIS